MIPALAPAVCEACGLPATHKTVFDCRTALKTEAERLKAENSELRRRLDRLSVALTVLFDFFEKGPG